METLNRRELLALGSAALLHLAVARPLRAHRVVPQFRCPLPVPPVLQPTRCDSAADYYEIAQREASVEIIPGMRTRVWGYDGIFPGPTIEARRGRAAVVTHTNRLGIPTVTHLHGGVTRPQSDGFPTDTVAPGGGHTPTSTTTSDDLQRSGITITAGVGAEEISIWVSPVFTC